ncbi:MAG: hypothetical protein ABR545_00890, partial [Cyclonatronaceae bacterium]
KAEYALRNLLTILRRKMVVVTADELVTEGGLYYGLNTGSYPTGKVVHITASSDAIGFFAESKQIAITRIKNVKGVHAEVVPILFNNYSGAGIQESGEDIFPDVIASAFYFLSDWQSGTASEPDSHGRFTYAESVQNKLGIDFPIVNEYALLLGKRLELAGIRTENMSWKGAEFALGLTHDIDRIRKKTKGTWARESVDFLLLNKNRKSIPERLDRWQASVLDLLTPGDTYQDSIIKLLDFSERAGIKPTFFIQSNIHKHPNDAANYLGLPFFDKMIGKLTKAGGEIGFHPGYMAGYPGGLFEEELKQLEQKTGAGIRSVRFHYLRFDAERFAGVLSEHSLENDSSLAWAEQAGTRTGCVSPHTLFDRNKNRGTSVLELPMTAMDVQLLNYMNLKISESVDLLRKQVDLVERYNGVVVWNFHHHTYDTIEAPGWHRLFEQSLNYAIERKPYNETFKGISEVWSAI